MHLRESLPLTGVYRIIGASKLIPKIVRKQKSRRFTRRLYQLDGLDGLRRLSRAISVGGIPPEHACGQLQGTVWSGISDPVGDSFHIEIISDRCHVAVQVPLSLPFIIVECNRATHSAEMASSRPMIPIFSPVFALRPI